jgi:hypothetical protein
MNYTPQNHEQDTRNGPSRAGPLAALGATLAITAASVVGCGDTSTPAYSSATGPDGAVYVTNGHVTVKHDPSNPNDFYKVPPIGTNQGPATINGILNAYTGMNVEGAETSGFNAAFRHINGLPNSNLKNGMIVRIFERVNTDTLGVTLDFNRKSLDTYVFGEQTE